MQSNESPSRSSSSVADLSEPDSDAMGTSIFDELSLIAYLESLDNHPSCLIDPCQALSFSSRAAAAAHIAAQRPPLRPYTSSMMRRLMRRVDWLVESITPQSAEAMHLWNADVDRGCAAAQITIDFLVRNTSGRPDEGLHIQLVSVTFMNNLIDTSKLPSKLRQIYPRGLYVMLGTINSKNVRIPPLRKSPSHDDRLAALPVPVKAATPESGDRTPQAEAALVDHADEVEVESDDAVLVQTGTQSVVEAPTFVTPLHWSSVETSPADLDSEMGRMLLAYPWQNTSLGPIQSWSGTVRSYVLYCMASPAASHLALGDDLILIYNDKYRDLLGSRHPDAFGKPMSVAWADVWELQIKPMYDKVYKDRVSLQKTDHLVWMQRLDRWREISDSDSDVASPMSDGSLEETYHSFSYTPLFAEIDGPIIGLLAVDAETTDTVIAQRYLHSAREVGLAIAPAMLPKQLYRFICDGFDRNPIDVPWSLVYSVSKHISSSIDSLDPSGSVNDGATLRGGKKATTASYHTTTASSDSPSTIEGTLLLRLQAASGLKANYTQNYAQFLINMSDNSDRSDADFPFPLHRAVLEKDPTHVYIGPHIMDHFEPRSWDSATHQAVICPIRSTWQGAPEMVIVLGLSSRRPYSKTYRRWLEAFCRQFTSSLRTVKTFAKEQRHLANLKKLDQAKTAFFTGVSHELRSPLTLIAGPASDAMSDETLLPHDKERWLLVNRAASRLLRLVNSLLDFASVEAGRTSLLFQPVRLCSFVADLASLFRSAIEKSGLTYTVTCQGDAIAYTDVQAYEKIVYNLISNALKYTREGGISVNLFETEHSFVLEVTDTGIGIPADELPKIFHRFHRVRAENSQARSIEGTGIGLAMTSELARLIKGDLSVESTLPDGNQTGGTRFRLAIAKGHSHLASALLRIEDEPITSDTLDITFTKKAVINEYTDPFEGGTTRGTADDGTGSVRSSADQTDLVTGKEAVVLVADDNADVRSYVTSILSVACRSVIAVADGDAALAILKSNARIDLVVSDVMMPRMDGFTLLSHIRKDTRLQRLPVILLSARAGSEATAEGIESGATDYLPKPFSSKELTARVRNALSAAKTSSRLEALVNERTAELAASHKRAEQLLRILPAGVAEMNDGGIVNWANITFCRMSDWSEERLPFHIHDWLAKVAEDDRPHLSEVFDQLISFNHDESVEPINLDWRWERKIDGQSIWCFCQAYPQANAGFVIALTDITTSKRLAEQSIAHEKQRADDAQHLARSQESFLDVVSHELRNPLSAILNCADLCNSNHENIAAAMQVLSDQSDSDEQRSLLEDARVELDEASESVQGIIASARHQSLIAGDILSVSRFNRGLLTVTPVDISLPSELQTIVSMFEIQTRNNDIALQLNLPQGLRGDFSVKADPTRLAQVLINLISNSCRILESHEGERRCSVDVRGLRVEPSLSLYHRGTDLALDATDFLSASDLHNLAVGSKLYLLFMVRDTGPGISPATQAQLFTKFNSSMSTDSTRSAVGGGAGLGLFLAKKLAQLMGGDIIVVSSPGCGADFIFYIASSKTQTVVPKKPLRSRLKNHTAAWRANHSITTVAPSSSKGDSSQHAADSKNGQDLQNTQTSSNYASIHCLIVEDNLLNQRLLVKQLTKANISLDVANNGLEAIEKIQQAQVQGLPFNTCLMDGEMPICGGVEATIRIRQLENQKKLSGRLWICGVTGNARDHFLKEVAAAGMDDVVTKPYAFKDILEKLYSATSV